MKNINVIQNFLDNIETVSNSIHGLNFVIPEEIFSVLDTLTNVIGYIMPLRLYTPIITLILSYWAICIVGYVYKGAVRIFGSLGSLALKLFK